MGAASAHLKAMASNTQKFSNYLRHYDSKFQESVKAVNAIRKKTKKVKTVKRETASQLTMAN